MAKVIDNLENGLCDNTVYFHSSNAGYSWEEILRIPVLSTPIDTFTTFDGYSGRKFISPFESQIVNDSTNISFFR